MKDLGFFAVYLCCRVVCGHLPSVCGSFMLQNVSITKGSGKSTVGPHKSTNHQQLLNTNLLTVNIKVSLSLAGKVLLIVQHSKRTPSPDEVLCGTSEVQNL